MKTDNCIAIDHNHSGVSTRTHCRRTLFLLVVTLSCAELAPLSHGVTPPPGGAYDNENTALGGKSLFDLTTGGSNTAIGSLTLYYATTGTANTTAGSGAFLS